MELFGRRDPHLAVQADVDDHTRSPQRLSGQPSELVDRIVEVSELVHQSFGVQRPALAVTGDRDAEALETGQRIGLVHHLGQLQMMARSALVVLESTAPPTAGSVPFRRPGARSDPGRLKSSLGGV